MDLDIREPWDYKGQAIKSALKYQDLAQANISNYKVGASVIARNRSGDIKIFGGNNIELSTLDGIHAERMALFKAISEGYIYPEQVFVVHKNGDTKEGLCGHCRQDFMYANKDCVMYIADNNGTVTWSERVGSSIVNPYTGTGKIR